MPAQFLQHPPDGKAFLPPAEEEERFEYGIPEPFQDMESVERGVEKLGASGSKESAADHPINWLPNSDKPIYQYFG